MKKILKVIFSLVIFCSLILLLPFNSLASEPEIIDPYDNLKTENAQKYQILLQNYKETHQKIIKELQYAKENSAEILKLYQEIDRLNKLVEKSIKNKKDEDQKKYQRELENLWTSLTENYWTSNAFTLFSSDLYSERTSKKKIESVLNDALNIYNSSINCFDNKKYTTSKNCESFRKLCVKYGSENGDMYYYELNKEFELNKIDVSENDPRLLNQEDNQPKQFQTFLKDTYQFCRLLSMTSSPFSPELIGKYSPTYFNYMVLPYPASFQKQCIEEKPSEKTVKRLFDLKSQYPNDPVLKTYSDDYQRWWSACDKNAQKICKNTFVLKDQIILTYETVACKNREVTKEDIEQDIMMMDSHADKLKHSTLLDIINACQKAHENDFFWFFQEPPISAECKKGPIRLRKLK